MKFNTSRPGDGLSLGRRGSVLDGVHFERALALGTERREDVLLLLLPERLPLPSEEVQEKHKSRVKPSVCH